MLRYLASACIQAPVSQVWAALTRLEEISLWSEPVRAARCEGPIRQGVGAERTCDLAGGITIRERWTAWDEGRSFTYEGQGIPLLAHAQNTWTVAPAGEATVLTSESLVTLKGGRLGRLLEPLVAAQIRHAAPRALAAFAYLVEHGEPPHVPHRKLYRVEPAC